MRKSELVRAIKVLSAANETPELVSVLQEIVSDPESGDYVRLIDREKYFATILWQTDDIRAALEDQGIDPTDENVNRVFENLGTDEMENCEHGWECIYDAIADAFSDANREELDVCPVCGAEINPEDGEDNGYGELHLYWQCDECGNTGYAIIDEHNDNAFVGHEVD